ncbi:MAG: SDR family oxidoreductase [Cyanobacteria bacterium P01_A01_bin.3]
MSKVALITGASAGIGRATAFAFASQGFALVLAARTSDPLTETAIALEKKHNCDVLPIPTDVSDPEQVNVLVEKAIARFDRIDLLINNAGICASGPFVDTSLEQWQQVMNVNFWGYVHTIRAVLPHMLARKQGQIVNVGSFGGKMPLPAMTAYCASKYAVTGLTETLRLEVESQGVQIVGVHPGVVTTEFLERAVFVGADGAADRYRQQMETTLSSAVSQTPEEIAKAIADACRTGQRDVVVGPAQMATAAYQLLPGLVGSLMGRAAPR